MATIVEISEADNSKTISLLQSYFQSGNLNFLLGSGVSMPAIPVASTIEAEINVLLKDKKEIEADKKSVEFLEALISKHIGLYSGALDADGTKTLNSYRNFLAIV